MVIKIVSLIRQGFFLNTLTLKVNQFFFSRPRSSFLDNKASFHGVNNIYKLKRSFFKFICVLVGFRFPLAEHIVQQDKLPQLEFKFNLYSCLVTTSFPGNTMKHTLLNLKGPSRSYLQVEYNYLVMYLFLHFVIFSKTR